MKQFVSQWDVYFLTTIIGLSGKRFFSSIMLLISHSGNGYYYPAIPLLLLLFTNDVARNFLIAGCIAFGLELPAYKLLKNRIKCDRPYKKYSRIHRRIVPSDRFSFPSGHSSAAFVIATLLAYFVPSLALPAIVWAMLVGLSRVYLGVHYPTDILAGNALGTACAVCGIIITY